jgi:nucleoid-associated protein YgaU
MAGSLVGFASAFESTVLSVVPIAGLGMSGLDVRPVRAVLSALDGPGGSVPFDFNPAAVKLERDATPHDPANAKSSSWEAAIRISGNLLITLEGVRFVGLTTKSKVTQLLDWAAGTATSATGSMVSAVETAVSAGLDGAFSSAEGLFSSPVIGSGASLPGAIGAANGAAEGSTTKSPGPSTLGATQSNVQLAKLSFRWGTAMQYLVSLRRLAVTYDRFSSAGVPLAATTNLQLQGFEVRYPSTNPTSGGPAGRASHTVVAGENLVGLATATYGTPRSWRAVAEANGLDDPLRLTPGRQLYLPSREELASPEGARR